MADILGMKLTYGAIEGSPRLRTLIAGLYEKQTPENVITAHGAIGANHLAIETLAGPGDEVVSVLPTYQQHYSIPEALGAEVHILPLRSENAFLPDLDELRGMVNKNTRLILSLIHIFRYGEKDLAAFKTEKEWLSVRGKEIAMVMQDPMTSLNPVSYTHLDVYKRQLYENGVIRMTDAPGIGITRVPAFV